MSRQDRDTLHATCVAVGGKGVLLTGPAGSGKSDLALRLIDAGRADLPASLVADDRVLVETNAGRLFAAPPPAIAGRLEVRGVGIIATSHVASAEIVLVVDLVDPAQVPRLPDRAPVSICGIAVPQLRLAAFEASAPAKIRAALRALSAGGFAEDIHGA